MKRKELFFHTLQIIIALLILIAFSSCNRNQGYVTYDFRYGSIVHFSFEYPSSYEAQSEDAVGIGNPAYLWHRASSKPFPWNDISILFITYSKGTIAYNATAMLDYDLANLRNLSPPGQFSLLERSKIVVSGVQGELAAIRYPIPPNIAYYGPGPTITRIVSFDKDDLIWVITLNSNQEAADKAKADFEHILQTFKFLE